MSDQAARPPDGAPDAAVRAATMRRVTRRIVPLLMLGYVVSYIDRINIGFAKFGLEESFGMSGAEYGFAAGIFFLGYVLAEVPSNIVLARVGARPWLARIMVTWGSSRPRWRSPPTWRPSTSCGSCSASPRRASSPASCST
ncbi:MFS transporter [Actinomadura kijaniata]|uniref:MFS transporter n=1 Tax=Actinomadura kijaniata TaxID=46161 RepID=UPI001C3F4A22|nr:MFS transporter [Actinomadura kijaniata]